VWQIRGRIGRGSPPPGEQLSECWCVLLYDDRAAAPDGGGGPAAPAPPPEKLKVLANTTDGFKIAEADLLLRGPGDFFGHRQSGFSGYKAAVLTEHAYLLAEAQETAAALLLGPPAAAAGGNGGGWKEGLGHAVGLMSVFPEPAPPGTPAPAAPRRAAPALPTPAPPTATAVPPLLPGRHRPVSTKVNLLSAPHAAVVFLDLETTGLSTAKDCITQLAAVVCSSDDRGRAIAEEVGALSRPLPKPLSRPLSRPYLGPYLGAIAEEVGACFLPSPPCRHCPTKRPPSHPTALPLFSAIHAHQITVAGGRVLDLRAAPARLFAAGPEHHGADRHHHGAAAGRGPALPRGLGALPPVAAGAV